MESKCFICPRKCGADRSVSKGVCGAGDKIKIARAAPHFWEEPCISGYGGSGAVFFSGCNMKCVYCQNYEISSGCFGGEISTERLKEIYKELISEGVHNINLVTPTHFSEEILKTLNEPLSVPVVYNTSGYDSIGTLRSFEGKIQIYIPDMKYMSASLAQKYSGASDYPETAEKAIKEMFRQTGEFELDSEGIMKKGVIIRHLMLPGELENTLDVIDWVSSEFDNKVMFSLMSQFTPNENCKYKELQRRVTREEYEKAVDYMYLAGIENGFVQDFSSATSDYTPSFKLEGVYKSVYGGNE